MNTEDKLPPEEGSESAPDQAKQAEIIRNDYGATKDSTVVVEEKDRTVVLTDDETIVIDKPETVDLVPSNRPRKVYAGMWGTPEIITVSLALLAVLTVLLIHIFVVFPAESQLEAKRSERDEIEKELISMRDKYGSMEDSETEAAKLLVSANDFETRFLKPPNTGKSALYERINSLMNAYGLVNTSGPDYTPLEVVDQFAGGPRAEQQRGRDRFLSLFPGVFVTVTVEGSYANLRRFISELENSREFITITSVELVPADREKKDSDGQDAPARNAGPGGLFPQPASLGSPRANARSSRGKTRGEIVSLKLEMVSYFRRPDFQPLDAGIVVVEQ